LVVYESPWLRWWFIWHPAERVRRLFLRAVTDSGTHTFSIARTFIDR
jgi:hypothetical protein